jgi:hypothetical protein
MGQHHGIQGAYHNLDAYAASEFLNREYEEYEEYETSKGFYITI